MTGRIIIAVLLAACSSGGKSSNEMVDSAATGADTESTDTESTDTESTDTESTDTDPTDTDPTDTDPTDTDPTDTDPTDTGDTAGGCATPPMWFADRDGDGHGDAADAVSTCEPEAGFVSTSDDCDDTDPTVYPGAEEVCGDGLANDCSASGPDCLRTGEQPVLSGYHARLTGPEGTNFGLRLTALGDLSGDGVDAFGVGTDAIAAEAGVEGGWIFSAPDGDVDASEGHRVTGTGLNGGGLQFLHAADWDGDGHRDVIVGAVSSDGVEGSAGGVVRLITGPVTGDVDLDSLPVLVEGSGFVHGAGAAGTILSDATGDGIVDLAVGAEWLGSGKVGFYEGPFDEIRSIITADEAWYGMVDRPNGRWVWSTDVDGDGLVDLLLGSPWGASEGLAMAGALDVHISEEGWGPRSGGADMLFSGRAVSEMLGQRVHVDSDLDGDGTTDLVLGANGAVGDPAHAYVVGLPTADHGRIDAVASGVIEAPPVSGWEGFQVSGVGDVDDDGRDDLVCGVPWDGLASHGAVVLVYGPIEGVISLTDRDGHRWWTGSPEARLGRVVESVGDQDGDGQADLLAVGDVVGVDATREVFLIPSPGW